MDLPEHAALIRNLRALGRRKEIAALCRTLLRPRLIRNLRAKPSKRANDEVAAICKDTLEPAIYRHAYPVLRAMCRRR